MVVYNIEKERSINLTQILVKEMNFEFNQEMIWTIFKWPQIAN